MTIDIFNLIGNLLIDFQQDFNNYDTSLIIIIPVLFLIGSLIIVNVNCINKNNISNIDPINNLEPKYSGYIPEPWSLFYEDNVTPQIGGLNELHNNIMFYLSITLFAVTWIILSRRLKKSKLLSNCKYNNFDSTEDITLGLVLISIVFCLIKFLCISNGDTLDPSIDFTDDLESYLDKFSENFEDLKENTSSKNNVNLDFFNELSNNYKKNYFNEIANNASSVDIVNFLTDITPSNAVPDMPFQFLLTDIIDGNFIHYDIYDMENRTAFLYMMEDLANGQAPVADLVITVVDPNQITVDEDTRYITYNTRVTNTIWLFPESYEVLESLIAQLEDEIEIGRRTFALQPGNNVFSYDNAARALVLLFRRIFLTYLHAKGIRPNIIAETEDADLI